MSHPDPTLTYNEPLPNRMNSFPKEDTNMDTKTRKATHTPTPWKFVESSTNGQPDGATFWLVDSQDESVANLSRLGGKAIEKQRINAAFIVRAVNSHEELLACLKGAMMIVKTLSSDNDTVFVKEAEQVIAKAEASNPRTQEDV